MPGRQRALPPSFGLVALDPRINAEARLLADHHDKDISDYLNSMKSKFRVRCSAGRIQVDQGRRSTPLQMSMERSCYGENVERRNKYTQTQVTNPMILKHVHIFKPMTTSGVSEMSFSRLTVFFFFTVEF